MKRICTFVAALLLAVSAFAGKPLPPEVKGIVKDVDGNPIAGAVVSDGFNVVVTDAAGAYCFKRIPAAYHVFVSVPSEYEIPLRQGQPVFYKKLGDDDAYNFVFKRLRKGPETDFNLFLMADPQCQWIWHVRRLRCEALPDVKAYSRGLGPCYAMTLGDIGYSENHRNTNWLLPIIREEMSADKTGMPVFQTVGNHDFDYALGAVEESSPTISLRRDRMYESVFGPANYSFNRGDAHIVSMNNVCFESFGYPGKYHGDFSPEQVQWLRDDLSHVSDDKLVIFCIHIPMENIWKKFDGAREVMEILAARSHAVVVSGHTHTIKNIEYENGLSEYVAGAMSGCWWWSKNCADGAPNGYAVWKISGNRVVDKIYKGQNFDESYQMRLYRGDAVFGGPFETFALAHGSGTILVNAWNADKDWKIEVYENGKFSGLAQKMPLSSEFKAPYNGGKDWWAIGYNVGVVGRGHSQGSTRNNYCSKNYHMYSYVLKDPSAKVKVVATDGYGRKFTETHFTTVEDYAQMAESPKYPEDPVWDQ